MNQPILTCSNVTKSVSKKLNKKKKQIQFKIDPHPNTLESYTRSSLKKYISACNVRTRARAAQLSARQ